MQPKKKAVFALAGLAFGAVVATAMVHQMRMERSKKVTPGTLTGGETGPARDTLAPAARAASREKAEFFARVILHGHRNAPVKFVLGSAYGSVLREATLKDSEGCEWSGTLRTGEWEAASFWDQTIAYEADGIVLSPEHPSVEVELSVQSSETLHVVDAVTGLDLTSVRLLLEPEDTEDSDRYGSSRVLVEDVASPVEFGAGPGRVRVESSGYRSVTLEPEERSASTVIRLFATGNVMLRNLLSDPILARISLLDSETRSAGWTRVEAQGSSRVEGIDSGLHEVALLDGECIRSLGKVQVTGGTDLEVVVDQRSLKESAACGSLRVSVVAPPGDTDWKVAIEGVVAADRARSWEELGTGVFSRSWTVPAGRHAITVHPALVVSHVNVTEGGSAEAILDLSDTLEGRLVFRDDARSQDPVWVEWGYVEASAASGAFTWWKEAEYALTCQSSPIWIAAYSVRGNSGKIRLTPEDLRRGVVVSLRESSPSLRVLLSAGGEVMRDDLLMPRLEAKPIGHSGRLVRALTEAHGAALSGYKLLFDVPGQYALRIHSSPPGTPGARQLSETRVFVDREDDILILPMEDHP